VAAPVTAAEFRKATRVYTINNVAPQHLCRGCGVPTVQGGFDRDIDYTDPTEELWNKSHPPPLNWRKSFPCGRPADPGCLADPATAPAENVSACVDICASLYGEGCRAASWNGPSKMCYLKTAKGEPARKVGDISFVLAV
jgi:hypothetical protein